MSQKFHENAQMKSLLDELREKYSEKPLFNLIMLDSKADLDMRMSILSIRSDSTEKFSAFESFGDPSKII